MFCFSTKNYTVCSRRCKSSEDGKVWVDNGGSGEDCTGSPSNVTNQKVYLTRKKKRKK